MKGDKNNEAAVENTEEKDVTQSTEETSDKTSEESKKEEQTPRTIFFERIKSSYPDDDFDTDEEEYFRKALSKMDDDDSMRESMMRDNDFIKRLTNDPAAAAVFSDFAGGTPLPIALRKYFSDEDLSMSEDDESYEAYKQAGVERENSRNEMNQLIETIKANSEISAQNIKEFCEEKGMDEETAEKLSQRMQSLMDNFSKGLFEKEILEHLYKADNHDDDVEEALNAGKVAGRNEQIVEKLEQKKGDGLPNTNGGGSVSQEEEIKDPTLKRLRDIANVSVSRSRWQ